MGFLLISCLDIHDDVRDDAEVRGQVVVYVPGQNFVDVHSMPPVFL